MDLRLYLKNKIVSLLHDLSSGFKFGLGMLAAFITVGLLAVAVTGVMNTFQEGETLTAGKLNTNFNSMKAAIESLPNWTKSGSDAVFSGGNVIIYGRISSSVLGVYCGNTTGIGTSGSFTNGSTQGAISYDGKSGSLGAKAACQIACGNSNAHMCTSHEISISRQLAITIDITEQRIDSGMFTIDGSNYGTDCDSWASSSSVRNSIVINHSNGPLWDTSCNIAKPLACCL